MFSVGRTVLLVSLFFFATPSHAYPRHWNDTVKSHIDLENDGSIYVFLAVADLDEIREFLTKTLTGRDLTDNFGMQLSPRFPFRDKVLRSQRNFRRVARRAFHDANARQSVELANLVAPEENKAPSTFFNFSRSDFWAQIVWENLPQITLKIPATQEVLALRNSNAFQSPRGRALIKGTSFEKYGVLYLGQLVGAHQHIEMLESFGDWPLVNALIRNARTYYEIKTVIESYLDEINAQARLRRNWKAHRKHLALLAKAAFDRTNEVSEWMEVASIPKDSFAHSEKAYAQIVKDNFSSLVRMDGGRTAWEHVKEIPVLQDDLVDARKSYNNAVELELQANLSVLKKACRPN